MDILRGDRGKVTSKTLAFLLSLSPKQFLLREDIKTKKNFSILMMIIMLP